jgi:hypothetical protein
MESLRPGSQLKFFAETAVSRGRQRQKMLPDARHKYSKYSKNESAVSDPLLLAIRVA